MTEPLRIGIACFSTFGGSGVIATEVGMLLAARGHRVHVFSDERPGRLDVDRPNIVFHRVDARQYPQIKDSAYLLALASAIVDVARRERLDIVHAHYALPHAVAAALARQVLGADGPRLVTTLHGTDITLVGSDPSFLPLTRHAILISDAVTTPSAWLREVTHQFLQVPPARAIDVIPNFVDGARFSPPPSPPPLEPRVLVHVSNFRPVKRVPDVVRVFARVRAARPARLLLVGDGPDAADVRALASTLGVADDVRFLGERVDLTDCLRQSHVFLLPSETESFGLAALEAMACGVPVVAARVGGVSEVILDGETGFLTPLGDVPAMAASVRRLLDDEPLRARMAAAARRRAVTAFQVEPAVEAYAAVYRRVLGI
ncbi:MAG TPA: N-acetyl-alpha-D-glucosaminyl L-malate synthase BshA [Polyangia bacterium]|nr:N-acetyl-alpha-D-glucosaminyl L-malate synthase BshA [Polyangia bacterium]